MNDIVKDKQLKEVLYGLDYIANKSKNGSLELGVNNCKLLLEEIEKYKDIILNLENERDILKSKLSETKADIHYLLENGERFIQTLRENLCILEEKTDKIIDGSDKDE